MVDRAGEERSTGQIVSVGCATICAATHHLVTMPQQLVRPHAARIASLPERNAPNRCELHHDDRRQHHGPGRHHALGCERTGVASTCTALPAVVMRSVARILYGRVNDDHVLP